MKALSFLDSMLFVDTGRVSFKGKEWKVDVGSSFTGCVAVCGSVVALTDNKKKLYLLDFLKEKDQLCLASFFIEKAAMKMHFYSDASKLIIGDKMGDLYSFDLQDLENIPKGTLLHGCVSMVTDLSIINDQKIIFSDRDEKIRSFLIEKPYEIEGFLLGHTEYVYGFCLFDQNRKVLSVGGDNRIILWDLQEIATLDCHIIPGPEKDPIGISIKTDGTFAIIFAAENEIFSGSLLEDKISTTSSTTSSIVLPSPPTSLDCDGKNFIVSLESGKVVKIDSEFKILEEVEIPSGIIGREPFKKHEHLRKMRAD